MANSLRPIQNGRHFAGVIFKRILLNKKVQILIKICSPWFNWQLISIGSDNGFARIRRQVITWANHQGNSVIFFWGLFRRRYLVYPWLNSFENNLFNKPLFEPMIVRLLTHVCVTRPQWAKDVVLITDLHLTVPSVLLFYLQVAHVQTEGALLSHNDDSTALRGLRWETLLAGVT